MCRLWIEIIWFRQDCFGTRKIFSTSKLLHNFSMDKENIFCWRFGLFRALFNEIATFSLGFPIWVDRYADIVIANQLKLKRICTPLTRPISDELIPGSNLQTNRYLLLYQLIAPWQFHFCLGLHTWLVILSSCQVRVHYLIFSNLHKWLFIEVAHGHNDSLPSCIPQKNWNTIPNKIDLMASEF